MINLPQKAARGIHVSNYSFVFFANQNRARTLSFLSMYILHSILIVSNTIQ